MYHPSVMGDSRCGIDRFGSSGSFVYSAQDSNSLNRPVHGVSWYDTLRFANWLHNGQPIGTQDNSTTEDGAYDMSLGSSVVRKSYARVWLPNEDEWYKAAYYKGGGTNVGYWDYATRSDTTPTSEAPPGSTNSANYYNDGFAIDGYIWFTDVGAYTNSFSAYGTFDQSGNVYEWNEAFIDPIYRCVRGGSYASHWYGIGCSYRSNVHPQQAFLALGFRIASAPEPTPVAVDIKPTSCPNPLNVKSKGVLPVAILGSEDFDVTEIDVLSVRLAGISAIRSRFEDVATPPEDANECECSTEGSDGYLDLTLKFETQAIVEALGEGADGDEWILELTGTLYDETEIIGEDCVIIRAKPNSKNK